MLAHAPQLHGGAPHLATRSIACACPPGHASPPADSIYRDDVVFRDPRNSFAGLKNYQTIFWSLRFHGRIFFSKLYVEVGECMRGGRAASGPAAVHLGCDAPL